MTGTSSTEGRHPDVSREISRADRAYMVRRRRVGQQSNGSHGSEDTVPCCVATHVLQVPIMPPTLSHSGSHPGDGSEVLS